MLTNEVVQRVNEAKFIGVIVDQRFITGKTTEHYLKNKSKSYGIISRIRNNPDIKSKKLIYDSLIHPYFTYYINVWSSTYQTNLKSLINAKNNIYALTLCHSQLQPYLRDIYQHGLKNFSSRWTD